MATTGDELILQARERAKAIAPKTLPSLDALRIEAKALFVALPEPPDYQRADDPRPAQARQQVGPALEVLARLLALSEASRRVTTIAPHGEQPASLSASAEFQPSLDALVQAMELHLRALAAIGAGQIVEGELFVSEAKASARLALNEGALFHFLGERGDGPQPVYDRASGVSRYDPRPEQRLDVQLSCTTPRCLKRGRFTLPARQAFHRLTCPNCKQPFSALIGRALSLTRAPRGSDESHYLLRFERLGQGVQLLEFDDAARRAIKADPGDLVALLYSCTGLLIGFENLTSGTLQKVTRKSACFVATMAFGEGAPELDVFRAYRDERLMPHCLGRAFVHSYYRHGRALADLLSRSTLTRRAVRWSLEKIHARLVRSSMDEERS
ncbi:MAG: hypothetical protein LBM75_03420 [Myxococcales bacterium]|nr:hypothetical protein [Myxococcales bacterium]